MSKKSTSPWVWLGCGCAVIAGILMILIGVAAFFGVRTARTMSDPEARREGALEIMSAGRIPAGYETELVLSIPLYARIVVLQGDGRQFVYLGGLRTKADLKAAIADETSFEGELRRAGVQFAETRSILARDALRVGSGELRYLLVDGPIRFDLDATAGSGSIVDFDFSDHDSRDRDEADDAGLGAAILIRCSEDKQPGLGLWTAPRSVADREHTGDGETIDSAAVRDALLEFIEQLELCRR